MQGFCDALLDRVHATPVTGVLGSTVALLKFRTAHRWFGHTRVAVLYSRWASRRVTDCPSSFLHAVSLAGGVGAIARCGGALFC